MMQVNSTFANFVNSELVGLVLDVLNGREVKVTRNAAILLIQELHRLSCNVDHACREKNTPQRQCQRVLFLMYIHQMFTKIQSIP